MQSQKLLGLDINKTIEEILIVGMQFFKIVCIYFLDIFVQRCYPICHKQDCWVMNNRAFVTELKITKD